MTFTKEERTHGFSGNPCIFPGPGSGGDGERTPARTQPGIGLEGAKAQEPPRVMYLLHGYSDDQSIWMRRTSVERYCAKYNLAVVMPAVNHSYYANELQGERYWDYVSQELPQMMHSMFRLSQAPGHGAGGGAVHGRLRGHETGADLSGTLCRGGQLFRRGGRGGPAAQARAAAHHAPGIRHGQGLPRQRKRPVPPHGGKRPGPPQAPGSTWPAARRISSSAIIKSLFPPWRKRLGRYPRETPGFGHEWAYWDAQLAAFLPFALGTEAAHGSRKA